jgi:ABC-type enterobactin transport system permease subunit
MKTKQFKSHTSPRSILGRIDRQLTTTILLGIALVVKMLFSLCQGSEPLTLDEVWQSLGQQGLAQNQTIIRDLQLPRILAAVIVELPWGYREANAVQ